MTTEKILGFIIVLVVALSLTSVVKSACDDAIEGTPVYRTSTTKNPTFSETTDDVPDSWENSIEAANGTVVNEWNEGEYVTTTVTGPTADFENGVWYQDISISDIYDGVSTATLAFKWWLIDDDNLDAIVLAAYICDGDENHLIWSDNDTEATEDWNSEVEDVTSVVGAAGTYTVYLRAEINPDDVETPNVIAGWDDASLTITTIEEKSMTGASKVMLQLVPLFYVVGLLGAAIAWVAKSSKK